MIIDHVNVAHPYKIVFPATRKKKAVRKIDILNYYVAISPFMIPYLHNRPLTMVRYMSTIINGGFYQKNVPSWFPHWIQRVKIKNKDGSSTSYVVCNDAATLFYLVTQNCLTPHLWLSQCDNLTKPDRIILDLDPSENNFTKVKKIALEIKRLLDDRNIISFPLLTGSRGIHIIIPLAKKYTFEATRAYAYRLAQECVHNFPKYTTVEINKKKRGKKIFIDYLRNSYGATAVAPYALRALAGGPVATPVSWDECNDKKLHASTFTIDSIFNRLKENPQPWENFFTVQNTLAQP